jgi:hypothetical protein
MPLENRAYGLSRKYQGMLDRKLRHDRHIESDVGVGAAHPSAVPETIETRNPPPGAAFDNLDADAAELLLDAFAVQ